MACVAEGNLNLGLQETLGLRDGTKLFKARQTPRVGREPFFAIEVQGIGKRSPAGGGAMSKLAEVEVLRSCIDKKCGLESESQLI